MVGAWGCFLIQGVRDPLGGINSLWPLFGIANQLLAAIALCLGTTIILKMTLAQPPSAQGLKPNPRRPIFALVTLIPLVCLLAVTMTAGIQKIFHRDPRIGFLAQATALDEKLPALEQALAVANASRDAGAIDAAATALHTNRVLRFNNILDAGVAGTFLVLVAFIALLSVREWILLIARRKLARLSESEPVWLPHYAIAEAKPARLISLFALALALARELSGEAQLERSQLVCDCAAAPADAKTTKQKVYIESTEKRFNGVTRCC